MYFSIRDARISSLASPNPLLKVLSRVTHKISGVDIQIRENYWCGWVDDLYWPNYLFKWF